MIRWNANRITFGGRLAPEDIFFTAQALRSVYVGRGYTDIILDFTPLESVFETYMVPLVALCRNYRGSKVDFQLYLPYDERLRSLFHNSNWAHLIDPNHKETTFAGSQHLAAQPYRNSGEQQVVVDRIMEVVLGSLSLQRKELKALEWCVNEITDNVINHAQSQFGGVVQATTYAASNSVEFVVADAGIGIAQSLGERDHVLALERAIQEGVTRNANTNQGNGLYGSFRVATLSGGKFQLHSGRGSLAGSGDAQIRTFLQDKHRRYPGTAVVSQIVCRDERLIEEALVFKGRAHEPGHDFVEKRFEHASADEFIFEMAKEAQGFGTRDAGSVVRNKIMNVLRAEQNYRMIIDFTDVLLISSSFADEAIAKPYVEMGPLTFMSRVEIINADRTIRSLIDRAILLRSSQAASGQ